MELTEHFDFGTTNSNRRYSADQDLNVMVNNLVAFMILIHADEKKTLRITQTVTRQYDLDRNTFSRNIALAQALRTILTYCYIQFGPLVNPETSIGIKISLFDTLTTPRMKTVCRQDWMGVDSLVKKFDVMYSVN